MSRLHGDASRKVSTNNNIKTPGPMMANITVKGYMEDRTLHRSVAGRSETFPGQVFDGVVSISEHDILFMFKDSAHRVRRGASASMYPGQIGYPIFSCFNGITLDKYELYKKLSMIGVAKTHTSLRDGKGHWSQMAIFMGGTSTVKNNGLQTILAGTPIRVVLYDAVHDPKKFNSLFEAPSKLQSGHVRVVAVLEPYEKCKDITMMLRHYHSHIDMGKATRARGHRRLGFGEDVDSTQFTAEACADRMISASSGTLLLGYMMGKFIESRSKRKNSEDSSSRTQNDFTAFLASKTTGDFQAQIDAFFNQGELTNSGLSEMVARMMFPAVHTDLITPGKNRAARKSGLLVAQRAQLHSSDLYESIKSFNSWEREWVIGVSQNTAAPNGDMDLIIKRA